MKFVLFNLAVVAALFFLFNPDRADLRALADRAYETAGLARDGAEKIVAKVAPPAISKPVRQAADATPKPSVFESPAPKPEIKPAQPAPKKQVASQSRIAPPKPVAAAPAPKLDPAVAQRRAEVLGIDAPRAAGVAVKEKLMSPEQRRRELFTLAEEMELFYVRRLSR